jgi:hypothetical protein
MRDGYKFKELAKPCCCEWALVPRRRLRTSREFIRSKRISASVLAGDGSPVAGVEGILGRLL